MYHLFFLNVKIKKEGTFSSFDPAKM